MIKMNEEELINYFQEKINNGRHKIFTDISDIDYKTIDAINCITDLQDKYKQLQNNWNELKKWLEENKYAMSCKVLVAEEILNKMQELEQGKMSEKELNEQYIRNKIGGICQDCMWLDKIVPIIREMLSEAYIDGLEQSRFDKKMLEIENDKLKEQVQDLKADYGTIAQIERDLYKEVIEGVRECIKKHIRPEYRNGRDNEFYLELNQKELNELLQILDKVKDVK